MTTSAPVSSDLSEAD